MSAKANLRDLGSDELEALVRELGFDRYRANQIFRWVHRQRALSFEEMTDLSKDLRAKLAERAEVRTLEIDLEQISKDGTRKYRLRTHDGRMIETVLIPAKDARNETEDDSLNDDEESDAEVKAVPEHLENALFPRRAKLTQCVSSQVGCALDCNFCATAQLGFGRQLSPGEILDQVYLAQKIVAALPPDDPTRRAGGDTISNLVFMGMGEPLHNYKNVMSAIATLVSAHGSHFSRRRITVSTAGLVPGIQKFAQEATRVNLAVSLNATTDEVRDEVMPINRKWNIAALLDAVRQIPLERRRRVTFEYVLLAGVNDSAADAVRLGKLLRGIPSKVNLIAFNPHPGAPYGRPAAAHVREFQSLVQAQGLAVYVRASRGDDIAAACGQLANQATELVTLRT